MIVVIYKFMRYKNENQIRINSLFENVLKRLKKIFKYNSISFYFLSTLCFSFTS